MVPSRGVGGSQLTITFSQDTLLAASGERLPTPVLDGDPAEIQPFALTAPPWIDAAGDGEGGVCPNEPLDGGPPIFNLSWRVGPEAAR